MSDAVKRTLRTIMQVVAAGALTGLIDTLAGGLTPTIASLVLAGNAIIVTYAHNWLEDNTKFPTVLKPAAPVRLIWQQSDSPSPPTDGGAP